MNFLIVDQLLFKSMAADGLYFNSFLTRINILF